MSHPPITEEVYRRTVETIEEALQEGFAKVAEWQTKSARSVAADRLGISRMAVDLRLKRGLEVYGFEPNWNLYTPRKPAFTLDPLPDDGELDAEALIARQVEAHARRRTVAQAAAERQVRVHIGGPIAIAMFGDPHVDDPGCAWGDLKRDVETCRDNEGFFAVDVGDDSNNWVGRLMRLYADQETTSKQALLYIEWLMKSLPWLLRIKGNHDCHDFETEALTARGWMAFPDIRADDQILSIAADGTARWSQIIERIERDNSEEMVSIEAGAISLCCTPKHRVLHRERTSDKGWKKERQYRTADNLPCRFALPVSAPSGLPDHPLADDWIKLTGWFLTDGGVHTVGNSPKITFYQSKPAPELEAALSGCCLNPIVRTRHRTTSEICGRALKSEPLPSREYTLCAEESRTALAVFQAKGRVPTWVRWLSDRQFDLFLGAVIAGDGAWATGGGDSAVIHGTKAFLESMQAACVQHGWGAHLSIAREKDWRLNVCRRQEWQAERSVVVKRAEAAPRVWCLRVPDGNFMVRRRGKAHFSGNCWNTEKGDPADYFHRGEPGLLEASGARMRLHLPGGANVCLNVRHDFPGNSQFNPAHALVRQTLFDFRDHILACGHRHTSGYVPIWHNDPKRLCHGFRVGTYKDFDHYAKDKGFKEANWARAMVATIDPDHADDPVRFIKPWFNVQEAAEYLKWRREKWTLGYSAAA